MANTFITKRSKDVSSSTTVGGYVVGSNIGTLIVSLSLSNTTASQVTANIMIDNGINDFYILKGAPIASGGTLVAVGGEQKIMLQTGDSIKVSASGNVDVFMNAMETTNFGITTD